MAGMLESLLATPGLPGGMPTMMPWENEEEAVRRLRQLLARNANPYPESGTPQALAVPQNPMPYPESGTAGPAENRALTPRDDPWARIERSLGDDAYAAAARRTRGQRALPDATDEVLGSSAVLPTRPAVGMLATNPYPESGTEQPAEGVLPPAAKPAGTAYLPGTGMEELPPSTNDPLANEPQVRKDGVPVPRPRPALPTDVSSVNAPPAGAPLSIAPPAAAASAEPAGIGGALGGVFSTLLRPENAPMLLALASGFSGAPSMGTGMRRAFGAAAPAAALMRREDASKANQADVYRALVARGVAPAEALAAVRTPELLKATIAKHFETKPAQVVNDRLVREKADGTVQVLADYSGDKAKPPAGFRWDGDVLKYIPGGPSDPKVKRELGDRQNAPPGYVWVDAADPEKGMKAIPGGPAEKVDAPVAARLGMAQSFLDQLPDIRKGIRAGEATGLWDGAMGKLNVGRAGELRRQIDSGAESLLRNLTGAGMNREEAANYVRRYQLEATDTAATVESKLNQLERELTYTMEAVKKGRGGTIKVSNGQIVPTDAAPAQRTSTNVPFKILP